MARGRGKGKRRVKFPRIVIDDVDRDGIPDTIVVYKRKRRNGRKYEVANVYLSSLGEKYSGRRKGKGRGRR